LQIILSKSKYGILTCNYKSNKRIYKNKIPQVIKYPKNRDLVSLKYKLVIIFEL